MRVPALVNLGLVLSRLKQLDAAVECNKEAIEIGTRLTEADPTLARLRVDTAGGQVNLASIYLNQGQVAEALELLKAARRT